MFNRRLWSALAVLMVLTVACWYYFFADKGADADVQKLADLLARKDEVAFKTQAEVLATKYKRLKEVMALFKPRTDEGGGIGVGREKGAIQPDGIEGKTIALAKMAPSGEELEKQADDLVRMTQLTASIAEIAKHKCEVNKNVGILSPNDWAQWLAGVQQSAMNLADAVEARDGGRVKAAAATMQSNCTGCHRAFRE